MQTVTDSGSTSSSHLLPTWTNTKKYIPLQQLGCGSFGHVWEAKESDTLDHVAIKQIFVNKTLDFYGGSVDKLYREVRILGQIVHPLIVSYKNCWLEGTDVEYISGQQHIFDYTSASSASSTQIPIPETNFLFIIMELCTGNLEVWLENCKLDQRLSEVSNIFIQTSDALRYIHDHNVIHRDLKPANILGKVDDAKIIWKLGDFGLSTRGRDVNNEASLSSSPVGTRNYRSPDVVQSSKSDVYSLGLIFLKVLDIPFRAVTEENGLPEMINRRKLSFPDNLGPVFDVVVEMLRLDETQRASANSVYARLVTIDSSYESYGEKLPPASLPIPYSYLIRMMQGWKFSFTREGLESLGDLVRRRKIEPGMQEDAVESFFDVIKSNTDIQKEFQYQIQDKTYVGRYASYSSRTEFLLPLRISKFYNDNDPEALTLKSIIDEWLEPEELTPFFHPTIKGKAYHTKRVISFPNFLAIQLQRFKFVPTDGDVNVVKLVSEVAMPTEIDLAKLKAKSTKKLRGELDFPEADPELGSLIEENLEGLANIDSRKMSLNVEKGETRYRLVGFISHLGPTSEWGKYVAYFESSPDAWTCLNLSEKEPVVEPLPRDEGYLYFYKRMEPKKDVEPVPIASGVEEIRKPLADYSCKFLKSLFYFAVVTAFFRFLLSSVLSDRGQ